MCQWRRGREWIPNRLHAVSTEPDAELELTNHEIMTWVEIRVGHLTTQAPPNSCIYRRSDWRRRCSGHKRSWHSQFRVFWRVLAIDIMWGCQGYVSSYGEALTIFPATSPQTLTSWRAATLVPSEWSMYTFQCLTVKNGELGSLGNVVLWEGKYVLTSQGYNFLFDAISIIW